MSYHIFGNMFIRSISGQRILLAEILTKIIGSIILRMLLLDMDLHKSSSHWIA